MPGEVAAKHDSIGRPSRGGDVVVNNKTGERVITLVGTGDGIGDRLAADLRVRPGGALVAEHYHAGLVERFRVISGTLEASLYGERKQLETGADVTIPPGMVHDWWNAGDEEARVLVEVTPGRRFEIMVTTLFGLANVLVKPPVPVQRTLFGPLALIGKTRGMKGYYPRYLEPAGHEEPDPELVALVA